MSKGEIVIS